MLVHDQADWQKWLIKIRQFYNKENNKSAAPLMTQRPFDNRPHLEININNRNITALLDTGSMRSILNSTALSKVMAENYGKIEKSDVPAITVANGGHSKVTGIISLRIRLRGLEKVVKFLIVPSLDYEFVLGADFCKIFQLSLHFKNFSWNTKASAPVAASEGIAGSNHLTSAQQKILNRVIDKFTTLATNELGCAKDIIHTINTGDAAPIKSRQYPLSPYMQSKLHAEIKDMLKAGVIEPSVSEWSSPLLLIKKKNGEVRTCFDGRKLNSVTIKDSYPLPRTDAILNRLRKAKYLTTIDLRKAFWQIPLHPSSRPKTAFCVPGLGLFQFCVLPFGLTDSPRVLQKNMEKILGEIIHSGRGYVYLDDTVVASETFEEHIATLIEIYEKFRDAGFKVNIEKCNFCRKSITFLGFIVDEQGLHTDPDKVDAVLRFKSPKTTTEVKRLIGLVSYYRIFLPNLSTVSSPITALIKNKKKGQSIQWTTEAELAFDEIKRLITTAPILTSPDFEKKFYVQCDASNLAVGSVLFQEQGGLEHPVAYASRALTVAEQKYSATERELIAVIFAINKFRGYIEGTEFVVITDCAALTWLHRLSNPSGRLSRWAMNLSQFTFEVKHRPGKLNIVPDMLSRDVGALSLDTLIPDEWYKDMIVKVNLDPEGYPNFRVEGERLYKYVESKLPVKSNVPEWKLVVPTENRPEVLQLCHDDPTSAHFGISKTIARITELYYWPKLGRDVKKYVSNCLICGQQKSSNLARPGLMGSYKKISFPFQLISLDLLGPLPRSKNGNQHLLVVTDWFTKYVIVHPMRNATAKEVVKFVENHVFLVFGASKILIVDNGVQFVSALFKDLTEKYGVQKIWFNAKYHPQVNPTERVNRVLVAAISSYIKQEHTRWDENVFRIARAINSSKHEVSQFTPSYLVFGRYVPLTGSFYGKALEDDEVLEIQDRLLRDEDHEALPELYNKVRKNLKQSYDNSKKRYDLRKRPKEYKINEKVWKRSEVLSDKSKQFAAKLAPKYELCTVVKKIGNLVYELKNMEGRSLGRWHVKHLKEFAGTDDTEAVVEMSSCPLRR